MPYADNFAPHTLGLDDCTSIWRYVSFPSLVSILQRRELFFAKLATLAERDPYEGKFSKGVISDLATRYMPEHDKYTYPDGVTFAHAIEERNRKIRAVNCWHMSENESAAMWKLYSGNHGIAIRTTLGAFKKSFDDAQAPVYIFEVEYLDFVGSGLPLLPFHSGFAKRKSFAHERELRAMPGTSVAVNLDALIETVFVAPEAEPWLKEVVEGVLNAYGTCKPVVQSVLYDKAVW
jgi:hypothetical protein